MSLTVAQMKRTPIKHTQQLGIANQIRGAVIDLLGVRPNGVRFAGGAARDMLDGVLPKDYDLIIPRHAFNRSVYDVTITFAAEAAACMEDLMRSLRTHFQGCEVAVYQAYEQSSGDFDERLLCAGYIRWKGVQVDILMSTYDTLLDAITHFDSDINQAFIDDNHVYHVDVGSYKMLREARSECRYQKLLAVAQRRGTHLNRYEPTEI
ncbi:polyA polymerase [Aeromonas phage Atoyac14]|uniref:PolyA polymerase n=1 Tax=Aeromonas phage Atoyac1 TaxID=2767547 RepID=A0A866D1H4_9CAUD|nr:polyA polymerase [Aeromonas phage Atoyac1]QOC54353.1 polyA polymerase [Aeromonas phage Atoyac14]